MTKGQNTCNVSRLSRFFDRELGPDESVSMKEHIQHCQTCKEEIRGNQFISSLLKAGIEKGRSQADLQEVEERVITLIRTKRGPWWVLFRNVCLSKKLYVPAAAVAAMLVMFLYLARPPIPPSGPSAIIDSLQGDFASVMILETQESRQTILWIHEASDLWDNGGDTIDQTNLESFSTIFCLTLEKSRLGWGNPLSTV